MRADYLRQRNLLKKLRSNVVKPDTAVEMDVDDGMAECIEPAAPRLHSGTKRVRSRKPTDQFGIDVIRRYQFDLVVKTVRGRLLTPANTRAR
jgi:hypothetical protein